MPETRSWSLAGRLTRIFLATTLLFIVAISATSAAFLLSEVKQRIDAHVIEELVELGAAFRLTPYSDEAFDDMARDELARHPDVPMGWRVWKPGQVTPIHEFGAPELLTPAWPAREPRQTMHTIDLSRRWRTVQLEDGTIIGIALDGSTYHEHLKRYAVTAGALLGAAFLINLVLARFFFKRVSRLLHSVAERTRAARPEGDRIEVDVDGAPREIREVSRALRETLEKIRAEIEQSRVFTAGVAHELRSPLQNLIGETEVTLMAARDADTYREVLRSNLDELRSLGDAIDNLVTICSRGETGRTGVRERFDLGGEARMRLQREVAAAQRLGVTLDLAISGDAEIDGDREGILRAVRNLAQNAIQWSPPGGHVRIGIVGAQDSIRVTVDDDGPGVPRELRQRIFEPFFRGPSAQGRRIGYGLGLALTRSAAEDQQGSIEVHDSPTGGARFVLTLARRKSTEAPAKPG